MVIGEAEGARIDVAVGAQFGPPGQRGVHGIEAFIADVEHAVVQSVSTFIQKYEQLAGSLDLA